MQVLCTALLTLWSNVASLEQFASCPALIFSIWYCMFLKTLPQTEEAFLKALLLFAVFPLAVTRTLEIQFPQIPVKRVRL